MQNEGIEPASRPACQPGHPITRTRSQASQPVNHSARDHNYLSGGGSSDSNCHNIVILMCWPQRWPGMGLVGEGVVPGGWQCGHWEATMVATLGEVNS